ncbi:MULTISPECIES: CGNR zinc finger domain-containing protein [Streptomyces]|uniref:CGNR zinc finger domain-containing protein n=1 Tax=Streptomyces TaxID=1883 RepID=UPI001F17B397|nr:MULTISPECIES: CGNR zinc finger domain-containing protein [Streptomyces]
MNEPGTRAPAPGELALVEHFVNTLDVETGRDDLAAPDGLAAFFREHGPDTPAPDDCDPAELRVLREALRAVCHAHAGADLPAAAAGALERLFAAAPLVLGLDSAGRAVLRPAPGLAGTAAFTARIAAAVAAAEADGSWPRLKACEAEDCRWAYYDRSPAGRSRWCSMRVCGSRAKMRAYRRRGSREKPSGRGGS